MPGVCKYFPAPVRVSFSRVFRESIFFLRMSSMANCRGLLVISLFLGALQALFMEPTYCIDSISDRRAIGRTNWEKNTTDLKGSSSRKLKGNSANLAEASVITVSKVKGQGDFTTVQDAIDSVPANNQSPVTIKIQPGIYREKVNIPAGKAFITLTGTDAKNTVITWNDSAKSSGGTFYSATVTVYASDFIATGITFENSFGPGDMTVDDQAVAVRISADRCAFYGCRFLGYQDTLLDESGEHYFRNCYIEGAIDMVCGNGKSIYEKCELHAIPIYGGAFSAQKRSSPSEDTGFVFLQCKLTGKGLMYLGRAWGPYSTIIYADTDMDDILFPEGWTNWNVSGREKTVTFVEFQNAGPGADYTKRVPWARQVTNLAQVAPYLSMSFINANKWVK